MSNIRGRAYAITVVNPVRLGGLVNRVIFRGVVLRAKLTALTRRRPASRRLRRLLARPLAWSTRNRLEALETLSLIHYARWAILPGPSSSFGRARMLFMSNFNGTWDQYIDSFSMAIPRGVDLFWRASVGFPGAVPIAPFHRYIREHQIDTAYYYGAYPVATTNDVKSGAAVLDELVAADRSARGATPEEFVDAYRAMLVRLQHDLSVIDVGPGPGGSA